MIHLVASRPSRFVGTEKVVEEPSSSAPKRREWKAGISRGANLTPQDAFHRRSWRDKDTGKLAAPDVIPPPPKSQQYSPDELPYRARGLTPVVTSSLEHTSSFRSYPLLSGLLSCLKESLGPNSAPFPIQSLSLRHFLGDPESSAPGNAFPPKGSQTLLASETGSGKSVAYLLPIIQALKVTESARAAQLPPQASQRERVLQPRALVLAPTHELCRQLSAYSKTLSHEVKLRNLCLSNPPPRTTASQMLRILSQEDAGDDFSMDGSAASSRQPDIVVGTPSKVAQMAGLEIERDEESPSAAARSKVNEEYSGPRMSFDKVEWVVIDEADVLFGESTGFECSLLLVVDYFPFADRDFRQLLHGILDAISVSKNVSVPRDTLFSSDSIPDDSTPSHMITPPYNLILTTATIPSSLNTHLLTHFPNLIRLTSPNLHKLPRKLNTERVDIKGVGNPLAAIHRKLVEIFADETRRSQLPTLSSRVSHGEGESRVILFCNHAKKAEEIGEYLEKTKMPALVMTGSSEGRKKGSNNHLEAFLSRPTPSSASSKLLSPSPRAASSKAPRILITTSLLARGLDFSPSISHVLIVDEPRNEVDFLHRAGEDWTGGKEWDCCCVWKGDCAEGPKKARVPVDVNLQSSELG